MISQSPILTHFDSNKELSFVCNANPYEIGAVLNVIEKGVKRPCLMVSSSLSKAQKNYSQLHREALAIVFAVRKFHKYIFGRKVIVYTDCKSLESILSPNKDLGNIINSRFLRWLLFLQNYDLSVKFRPSKHTKNADGLSRVPTEEIFHEEEISLNQFCNLNLFNDNEQQIVSIEEDYRLIKSDKVLHEVLNYIKVGWTNDEKNVPHHVKKYYALRSSLPR